MVTQDARGGGPDAVHLRGIVKRFGPTVALAGVDLTVPRHTILALLGENGAGKSSLVKILTGVVAPDAGRIVVDGVEHSDLTPRRAREIGIARVAQELSLFPDMTVAANVLIGREPRRFGLVDRAASARRATELLELLGIELDPYTPVRRLSLAERQLVEIAKAMAADPKILVLDEPTSGLREHEVERLFEVMRRLRGGGTAIMFISHRMDEVFAIADRITVLKDGRNSGDVDTAVATDDQIVRMMVGREVSSQFPIRPDGPSRTATRGRPPVLRATRLAVPDTVLRGVDLQLWPGEVCGLAGLQGQGQMVLLEALFGLRRATGELTVAGIPGPFRSPAAAIAAGVAFVPEDRKLEGGHVDLPVRANVTLPTLGAVSTAAVVDRRAEREVARRAVTELSVHPADPELDLRSLSGGNQQKVVLAKWLETEPDVLLLADPTRGVDVGTKQEMYRLLRDQAAAGVAVLLLSTELMELIGVCDRILVMSEGRLVADLDNESLTEEGVLGAALGGAA
jgi:ABC-type sugar transport system ATPase subunit